MLSLIRFEKKPTNVKINRWRDKIVKFRHVSFGIVIPRPISKSLPSGIRIRVSKPIENEIIHIFFFTQELHPYPKKLATVPHENTLSRGIETANA